MLRWRCANPMRLALLFAIAGCAAPGPYPFSDNGFRGQDTPRATALPETPPTPASLDLIDLPPQPVPPPSARPDRALSEQECLALAAANATGANLLEQKARECCTTSANPQDGPSPGAMQAEILGVTAAEQRNSSAGACMELYYRLAQIQAQQGVVAEGVAVVGRALDERKVLGQQGVKAPDSIDALRPRLFALRDQQSELERSAAQLSAELRRRLNLAPADQEWLVRPALAVKVDALTADPAAAIREGLARRPEVTLLRRLDYPQSPQTLRALRQVLGTAHPLLTMACRDGEPSRWSVLQTALGCKPPGSESDPAEMATMRTMWDTYRSDREQEITKEIRVAAYDLNARVNQVIAARDQVSYWRERLDRLRAEEAKGVANYAERVEAELKRLEAQSTLWERAFAWEIARVKLRQAQFALLP